MDNKKKQTGKTRRDFFSGIFSADEKASKPDMIKMLTPDGKLVEVERSVYEQALQKKKATNREIFDWMQNPSKKNS